MISLEIGVRDFTTQEHDESRQGEAIYIANAKKGDRKLYIESYGCAMNFSDSEVVASILQDCGFETTKNPKEADVALINTCSIREGAEQRTRNRLKELGAAKKAKPSMMIGVIGCMAERLKAKFLEEEKLIDLVVGPDAYRDLPRLVQEANDGRRAINVLLSREETYADISPLRINSNGVTAFISIMRGCDNMCSFCVVPFTRGRERSRDVSSILQEARALHAAGYREVTLLGQNVDSYRWENTGNQIGREPQEASLSQSVSFAKLLELVACIAPDLRVRFSTSHPKDLTDEVLHVMARYDNICKCIHLPVQSGSTRVLSMMNRTYTKDWYMERIEAIRRILPNCAITTDIIAGFCSETEEEHQETLSLMDYVRYDYAYMFSYSERPGTLAAKRFSDDVTEVVKQRRLREIIDKQRQHAHARLLEQVNKAHVVLIEGYSKRSKAFYCGRNDQNAMLVFPKDDRYKPGQYVTAWVDQCTPATLIGKIVNPARS